MSEDKNFDNKVAKNTEGIGEDATDYGEFITSYFAWVPLPIQKEKAEEMENMTKKEEKKRK